MFFPTTHWSLLARATSSGDDQARRALDNDGDGSPDARELAAGTDPANPSSVFRILSFAPEAGGLRLTWSTAPGRSYVVQTNDSPADPFADFTPPVPAPPASPIPTIWTTASPPTPPVITA